MKVAYLGKIQLSDVDLSYIHSARNKMDITYILEISPRFSKGPAISVDKVYNKSGIFKAKDVYPEFAKYDGFIDTDKFYVINTCGSLWHIKAFWTNTLLLLFLLRNKFNVIHVAWPPNIYEFILYILKKRMLLTVHDPFPHTGLDTFIVRLRRKFAFRFIPKLIVLNKAQKQEFINHYRLNPDRVAVSKLSCYTYLRTIQPDVTTIPAETEYILFAGKISPYKGVDYLLPAMEKVHTAFPNVKLIVAGGGNYHFDISRYKQLDYIDIRNRFVPDAELIALIKGCTFMICPYTDATQSGVIMSAFAFAKPVIATNVGGLPEMIGHGKFGLIVKEKNSDAIYEATIKLLRDRTLLQTFADNISQSYETGSLSWDDITTNMITEYKKTAHIK